MPSHSSLVLNKGEYSQWYISIEFDGLFQSKLKQSFNLNLQRCEMLNVAAKVQHLMRLLKVHYMNILVVWPLQPALDTISQ